MRNSILALCAIGMLAGCGTITRGSSEEVVINAQPAGTKIVTSTGEQCETSCVLDVPRRQEFTVTASKAGYQTEVVQVRTKVTGGGATSMAGNVLVGGVIGAGIDAANGTMLDHTPNPVNIELEPEGVPQIPVATEPAEATAPSQVPTS